MTLAQQIIEAGLRLLEEGLTHGTAGNVSARCPDGESMLITPSGRDFRQLRDSDIVRLHLTSTRTEGHQKPSSEWRLHLAIYRARCDVHAVIHHHATFASAVAVAQKTIPVIIDEAADIGPIPTTPYALSGSQELAEVTAAALARGSNAVLLANHGAVAVGRDLGETMHRALEVERLAQMYIWAEILGGARALDETEVSRSKKFLEAYRAAAAEGRDGLSSASITVNPICLKDIVHYSFQAGITFASLVQSLILQKIYCDKKN